MKKEKSLTGYLFTVNGLQLALSALIMLLASAGLTFGNTLRGLFFVLQCAVWCVFAFVASLGADMHKNKQAVAYSLLAVAPAALLAVICLAFGMFSSAESGGWAQFYFFGAPLSFFLKPAVFLDYFIKNSAYTVYFIDIAILAVTSFIGCLIGIEANKKKVRKHKSGRHTQSLPTEEVRKAEAEAAKKAAAEPNVEAPPAEAVTPNNTANDRETADESKKLRADGKVPPKKKHTNAFGTVKKQRSKKK